MEPTDPLLPDLFARARGGDRQALDELITTHRERLERVARAELGAELRTRVRTSDVLQSTYLEILGSIESFRGEDEEAFVRWVVRILKNNVRDTARFFRASKRATDRETSTPQDADALARVQPTPSAEAALADEIELVGRALSRLPKDYKQILVMRMQGNGTNNELAQAMDRSDGATRVLLARARAALLVELDRLRERGGNGR